MVKSNEFVQLFWPVAIVNGNFAHTAVGAIEVSEVERRKVRKTACMIMPSNVSIFLRIRDWQRNDSRISCYGFFENKAPDHTHFQPFTPGAPVGLAWINSTLWPACFSTAAHCAHAKFDKHRA